MQQILEYWFNQLKPNEWWEKNSTIDNYIRVHFSELHHQATLGELWTWRKTARGQLAEIIILDQFSRHIFRDDPRAFAYDGMALILAQMALQLNLPKQLTASERLFMYLPFMHSESLRMHEIAMELFSDPELADNLAYEKRHKEIIERFGRYPHRNSILKRESTKAELQFLQESHSSF